LEGFHGLLEQVCVELFELGPGQALGQIVAVVQVVDLDLGLVLAGESSLALFHLPLDLLQGLLVARDVLASLLLDHLDEMVHQPLIEIRTPQMGVPVGADNLEHTVVDGQDRHIEGTSAKIEHQDVLLCLLVQPVSDGCRGGLVQDTNHVQARDDAGILGGLPLGIVEVGRDCDDGVLDGLAGEGLRDFLHLAENHGRNFLRRVFLILALDIGDSQVGPALEVDNLVGHELLIVLDSGVSVLPADEPLDIVEGAAGVDSSLVLGSLPDEPVLVREGHHGGGDPVAQLVRDDLHHPVLVDAHAGVGGPQVDPDDRAFVFSLLLGQHCQPKRAENHFAI
jgi:hypothetical protein